jgi:hypothetical protein
MDAMKTFFDLCNQMRGAKVIHKRMFLSTLQLYLLQDEGNDRANAMEIWCESPWQLADATEVVLADSSTMDGDRDEHDAAQRLISQAADVLKNRTVEDIYALKEDFSLCIVFSGGLEVCTFPSQDGDYEQWVLRGSGGSPAVGGCKEGIYPVEWDPEGGRV